MASQLSDGWGEFLSGFHWDWYVTLTFAGDVKTFTARNRCAAWLRNMEKAAGQPIAWFRGDEYGEKFGKFHMHLLISNVAHLHRFTFMKRWEDRNGYARIFEFDSNKGAAFYVSKYVTKQFGEWDLSENIEAFRIQQSNLALLGQHGRSNGAAAPQNHRSKSVRIRSERISPRQLPISDFMAPDLDGFEKDSIQASFDEQTKRKR